MLKSIWLRLCRPRGKAGVGLWGFLWVFAGSGGPWRWSLGGVLMAIAEFRKRLAGSKTTQQKLSVDFEENCSKKGPTRGPEIADPRAV